MTTGQVDLLVLGEMFAKWDDFCKFSLAYWVIDAFTPNGITGTLSVYVRGISGS